MTDFNKIDSGALEVCKVLKDAGYKAYLVGGCVRDLFLGKTPKDWDITSNAKPEETVKLFESKKYKVIPTGLQHGTVTIMIGKEPYEVTVFRSEGEYSDGRRPDKVDFIDSIDEDLARRDLTINAMALDPISKELIDPFGGLKDLEAGLIKAVGDPNQRFSEDGLRTMRAARFAAAFGFDLDPETKDAISNNLETLSKVSKERVRDELIKTIKGMDPVKGLIVFKETGILPIISPLFSNVNFDLILSRIDLAKNLFPQSLECKLALLLLDLGPNDSEKCLRELKFSNDDIKKIIGWIKIVDKYKNIFIANPTIENARKFLGELKLTVPGDLAINISLFIKLANVLGLNNIDQFILFKEEPALTVKDLKVDGNLLISKLGLKPGPEIKKILEYLLSEIIKDPSKNDEDTLLSLAKAWLESNNANTLKVNSLLNKASLFEKLANKTPIKIRIAMLNSLANWHLPEEEYNRYLNTVYNIGKHIIPVSDTPELHFKGVPAGPEEHHPEIYQSTHNDLVFERAKEIMPNMPEGQYAALLHDVGKGVTDPNIWPRQLMHESLGGPLADTISDKLKVPESYKKIARFMAENHLRVHQVIGKDGNVASAKAIRKLIQDFKNEVTDDKDAFTIFLLACQADAQGRTGHKDKSYPQVQKLLSSWDEIKLESEKKKTEELAINANDLMQELNIPPGKMVGMILGELKKFVKENPDENNHKDKLLEKAKSLLIG